MSYSALLRVRVQHDGRLPFWKPASVFAHYVRILIVFAIGKINILSSVVCARTHLKVRKGVLQIYDNAI